MKAEINNENKAKFFALYWGQKIGLWNKIIHAKIVNEIRKVNHSFIAVNPNYSPQIILKPLSKISDEDKEYAYWPVYPTAVCVMNIDYLRSKGYALSWMGLSVEEMCEAGWIKLTEV